MRLTSPLAEEIYNSISDAKILDFHTHLPQDDILSDHRFADLWELWLKHDHYKWRVMRACGVQERFITGDASPYEKFHAFASILPLAIGNPVHQWAHMELKAVFGITQPLNSDNAKQIWDAANHALKTQNDLTVRGLLKKFNVHLVCTTDDPAADLTTHIKLAADSSLTTKVLPTFRPDRFCSPHQPEVFNLALSALAASVGYAITSIEELDQAITERHAAFHAAGCRMSDHGLPYCPTTLASDTELETIFSDAIDGKPATDDQRDAFAAHIMQLTARLNTEKNWTMQLHLGPLRSVNSKLAMQVAADSGFDTMGAWPQVDRLVNFLDQLTFTDTLPQTIVYNLNPAESEAICCALQNFQSAPTAGKIQYGPAWWHCDHARGIHEQLDILTSLSALGTHIGMLTDSRSFTSYVRHDFYRIVLCNFLADKVRTGEIPDDLQLLKTTALNIAYKNAQSYLAI